MALNISEIVATTLRNRSGKIADGVSKNNPYLDYLTKRGKQVPFSGGRTIVQELSYQETQSFAWYSGYEAINMDTTPVLSAAEFDIKQAAISVSVSGLEQLQNNSKEAVIDLLQGRIENAERTLYNNIGLGVFSDGTGDGGKQIGGLQLLVADTPTSGTVGGIDRATNTFWRNVSFDFTTDGGAALSATNILSYMNRVYAQIVRGAEYPDMILMDNNAWNFYVNSLQAQQRFTTADVGKVGFASLKYMNSDVMLAGGYGGGIPATHIYMLNTNFIFYRPHSERNMVPIGADRVSVNQDAVIKLIGWAGNMTLSNAFLQAVLKD